MENRIIKLFLKLAISITFLSAIADRLGYWPKEISAWGHWDSFLEYTKLINPLVSESIIPALGLIVTVIEIIFAIGLLIGFKTELIAKLSGALLLLFALAMSFSIGIKSSLDYSVFTASAASFALSLLKEKYLELDILFKI